MPSPTPLTPQVFPPVMRRGLRWLIGLSTIFVLAPVVWVLLRGPLGIPRGFAYRYGALVMVAVPLVIIWPLWMLRTRHIRRGLLESEGRLCTHCAYNVSSLPPSGTCPECGNLYDIETDKVLWEAVGARFGSEGDTAEAGPAERVTDAKPPV